MIYYHERQDICTSCKKEKIPNGYFFKLWIQMAPEGDLNWDAHLKGCLCQDCFEWLADSKLKENFSEKKMGVHNSRCPYCNGLILPAKEKMYMEVSAHILAIQGMTLNPMGGVSSCVVHENCFKENINL